MAPKAGRRDETLTPETKALTEKYHDLAMKIGWDFIRSSAGHYDADDIISVAVWGLVDAALRWPHYCLENGYATEWDDGTTDYFNVFCQKNVRGAILDYCRREDFVPREVRELARDLSALQLTGITLTQAAEIKGVTLEKANCTMAAVRFSPTSVDDLIEDALLNDVETSVGASYLLTVFAELIEALPRKSKAVLSLRYYVGMELPEIAVVLGVSGSAVQKLHTDTIMILKQEMEKVASGA